MQFLTDQLQFLGLKENEIRVFTALATFGQMNVAGIARKSGVVRSTVVGLLPRMCEQGIVEQVIIGKHYEYTVNLENVANRLDWLERRLREKRIDDSTTIEEGEGVENAMPQNNTAEQGGNANIPEVFAHHAGTRMQMLVARDDAETLEHTLVRAEEYLAHITTHNLHAVLITCPTIAEYLQTSLHTDALPEEPHRVRLHVVPPAHCATQYDIIAFHDTVLLRNIHNHTMHAVTQHDAVEAYNHLLRIARGVGWSVSVKEWAI
jgi:predicted DNA-binding transcriptional regulator